MEKKLQCGNLFKRVLSLALALFMLLSLVPAASLVQAAEETEYSLIGFINGADHGCEGDYANPGDYRFVDGKLTVTFTQDSYVFVKTTDNANWYMAESYCTDTSVTLKNTNEGTSEKMFVPGNVELTFTLAVNDDGSLTLSYANAQEEPAVDYYLIGYINGADYGCEADYANLGEYKFVDGILVATFTKDSYVFVKTGDNANWYMAESYCADTSVTLKNTNEGTSEKMFVPGNVELTFTLVVNDDGTLTLSYTKADSGDEGGGEDEVSYTATIHYHNTENWAEVCAYAWNDGGALLGDWPGTPAAANEDNSGWYDAVVTTDANGCGFIFNNNGNGAQTADLSTGALSGNVELWVTGGAVSSTAPEDWAAPTAVTLHFMKPAGWGDSINVYLWSTSGGAVSGYGDYNAWPGKPVSDADGDGWYDMVVETEKQFNFIFNGTGGQTSDLTTGEISGSTELWVVDNTVYTEKPGYTTVIHFKNAENWSKVNAYVWDPFNNSSAIPGYEAFNTWPGAEISLNEANAGWYDLTISKDTSTGFNFIFNNGSGSQTGDLWTGDLNFNTELWVAGSDVSSTAPEGWSDPNRRIYVPGTFPGPSWDAGSNQMTYDEALGLYVYTFENVPAANYEYKIAVNGSWTENYGVGGEQDGANYAVPVPKTMDVTVYYNDNSHNSVTSVTYKFVEASVAGTGLETTEMTDKALTGIYSGTAAMKAGTYSDVVITCDGKEYAFAEFVLEEDKDVTFYIDPVTGIFYHNGANMPVDTASIYYNSQDEAYKAPFGAVATGEEVAFSIATGDDITSAVLVIKGIASVPMEKNAESGLWTCTTVIDSMGEYDYYFVMSNGSAVSVYGDDDGYYGEGRSCDLTDVIPYDLVVYQAGYETPDWMKNAVVYQIFPDRFFDGNEGNNQAQTWARGEVDYEYITDWYAIPENPEQEGLLDETTYKATGAYYGDGEWSNEIYGGDLEGITERIDYLKALGVNVIYLNPVFWSISNHRYDAVDYTEIDPILGTLGDFEQLVAAAQANDMHIILDGVFNHVSDDSVYFDRYYRFLGTSEKIGAYPYWAYVYDYMSENGAEQDAAETAAKAYFGDNYGITDYSYTEWFAVSSATMEGTVDHVGLRAGKEVYAYEGWWGYDSMPVVYSTNGSEYQTGNWAEEIIYNNANDSVTQYWIAKGNNGWRLDVANEVSDETWQKFRASVKALDSDAVIIGEIWDDATKYLMGDMYDSVMNYQFRNAVTSYAMGAASGDTAKAMEKIRERYPEEAFYAMMNLVGSHDTTRLLSYLDGIGDDRADKSISAAFPTYESTSQLAKDRQYLVAFLQFTYAGAPTIYYGDEIGMVGADDPDDRRAFAWGKGSQELVEWYASLAAIREAYPALRTGTVEPMDLDHANLLGYIRSDENTRISVLANNASSDVSISFSVAQTLVDVITGTKYPGGTSSITIPAMSGLILVPEEDVVEATVNKAALAPAYAPSYIVKERSEYSNNPFTDVLSGEYYTEPVLWAVDQKITTGLSDTIFGVDEDCTRAQIVTFLWRAAGCPEPAAQTCSFTDVERDQFYSKAVVWAVEEGITTGLDEATFGVNEICSRAQVVTFLWRYAGCPESTDSESRFEDVAYEQFYTEAILWAVENGITTGLSETVFGVNTPCSRAQVVTFLYRALK
ncbi:MAG: starch-binding protein [Oscillospiraceae bacterium]|nr:starch-binding protein [Oscillospiraceae bacterium]